MSNSVDQRIVEMQFDNKEFENGIQTSLKSLDALKKGLKMDAIGSSLEEIGSSVSSIANKFTFFGRIACAAMDRLADSVVNTGLKLAKSLSIDQVSAGWSKYAEKTTSVQTIMNATGKSIEEVGEALDKLMWFSDETSYSFTEMTSALATMTSSGGDIETLIPMLEGIAAATAFAGKGASEFSRVIYNLNQSYGQGYLSYLDWKSVEAANVGSAQLKQELIDAGVAAGTLKRNTDGTVKTLKGTVVTVANMGTTLSDQWATTAVMEEAFGNFGAIFEEAEKLVSSGEFATTAEAIEYLSDNYDEVYVNAAKAAQQAKTFTEAIDATKDAVSSGWMKTFEIIFGNYQEATELWTELAEILYQGFAAGADSRNELLQAWKDAGGRDDLIKGLSDALWALLNIVQALKGAIEEIFPPPTVETLTALTQGVKEFGASLLKLSGQEDIEKEIEIETSLNADPEELEKNLKQGMSGDEIAKLQERLMELGYDLGPCGADGIFGPKTLEALKQFQKESDLTVDGIYGAATHETLWNKLFPAEASVSIEKTTERVECFSSVLERLKRIVKGAAAIFSIVWKGIKFVGSVVKAAISVFSPIGDALLTVMAAIGDCFVALNNGIEGSGVFSDWLATIVGWLKPVSEWVGRAANAILDFFGLGKNNETNESLMTFSKLWKNINSKLAKWGVWEALKKAWNSISDAARKLGEAFKKLWAAIKESWSKIKAIIGEKLSGLFEKLGLKESTEELNLAEVIIGGVGKVLSKAIEFIAIVVEKLPGIIDKIVSFAGKVGTCLSGLWSKLKESDKFKSIIGKIGTFFKELWNAIKSFFSGSDSDDEGTGENGAVGKVEEKVEELSSVGTGLSGIWSKISPIFQSIGKGFKSFVDSVGGFGRIVKMVIGAIAALSVVGLVKSISGVFSGVSGLVKTFSGGLKTLVEQYKANKKAERTQNTLESIGSMFKNIAIAIGVIVAAIYILGKMDSNVLKTGGLALAAIFGGIIAMVLILALISKLGSGKDTFDKKAFSNIAKALLKLSVVILVMTIVVKTLGKMDTGEMLSGLLGLLGIVAVLSLFMLMMKAVGNTKTSVKGLLSLSVSLLILTAVMKIIGRMSIRECIQGLVGLAGVVLLLSLLMKSMHDVKLSTTVALIAVALAIGKMASVLSTLGELKTGTLLKGIVGLLAICIALRVLMKAMSKIDIKSGIGFLVGVVGLIGLMVAFSYALGKVKEVDPDTMLSFGLGLTSLLVGLGVFTKLAGSVGLKGVLVAFVAILAIAAAIGLVIAAFAGLSKIPGFQDFMNSGAASIGSIFGTLVGSFQASKLSAMAVGLSSMGNVDVDESGLKDTLACAQLVADFAEGLPKKSVAKTIVDCLFGSELEQFSDGMVAFGEAARSLSTSMNGVSIDQNAVNEAVTAAMAIQTVAEAVGRYTIGESIAIKIAGESAFDNFCKNIPIFATGIRTAGEELTDLPKNLVSNVTTAVTAAEKIQELADAVGEFKITEAIANKIAGESKFATFCGNIGDFATNIATANTSLEGLSDEGNTFTDDMAVAIACAESLATFFSTISGMEIEKNKSAFATFFTGENKTDSFLSYISTFATNIATAGEGLEGLAETSFSSDMTAATNAMSDLLSLFRFSDLSTEANDFASFDTYGMDSAINNIERLGSTIKSFTNATADDTEKGINRLDRFSAFASAISMVAESMVNAASVTDPENSISVIQAYLEGIEALFSSDEDTGINTNAWLEGLDAAVIADKLSAFTTDVGSMMGSTMEVMAGYTSSFNTSGTNLASALGSGIGENVDTSSVDSLCLAQLAALESYTNSFKTVGYYYGVGLGEGIQSSKTYAVEAAAYVAKQLIQKVKDILKINSPSRVSEEMGMYFDKGLANGLTAYSSVVAKSAEGVTDGTVDAVKDGLSNFSSLIADGIEADPVVRPIVDLSNVSAGARAIGNMIGGSQTISMEASANRASAVARSVTSARTARQNQSTGGNIDNSQSSTSAVNLSGNNFYVRSDQDVRSLASEIATLVKQQQRSLGAGY